MKDLAHSLATRKGQAVARDPFADSFDELDEWQKESVYSRFAEAHNWAPRVMRYVPAKHFGHIASELIHAEITEREIRDYAPEVEYDPDAPFKEIASPVASAIEESRERFMAAAAERRDDVEYDEDPAPETPYHERFTATEEDDEEQEEGKKEEQDPPEYEPTNTRSSHHTADLPMPPSSQKARDYGEWTDSHRSR